MQQALVTPIEMLESMGAAAREYVRTHHDALREAGKLKELFERHGQNDAFDQRQ
jgi:hypothetical protein